MNRADRLCEYVGVLGSTFVDIEVAKRDVAIAIAVVNAARPVRLVSATLSAALDAFDAEDE